MNKYEKALKQYCNYCGTSKANCNKNKCNRYNTLKELVDATSEPLTLINEWLADFDLNDLKHIKRICNELIRLKTIIKEVEQ